MADEILSTSNTNFNKTVQELIRRTLEELLRAPLPHLLPGNFIQATHDTGSNSTMRFLNVPDITVDAAEAAASLVVSEGVPNETDKLAQGYEEFATRQRMKTLAFTDVALLQNPNKLFAVGANRLARYVMELGDYIAAAKIITGTNVIFAGTSNSATADVAAGDILTSTLIKKGVALLEDGSVPRFPNGYYRCIIHPFVKFDIESDDDVGGWIDASRYAGSEQLFSGELGRYAGVTFFSSPRAGKFATGGTGSIPVYSTTIFGPDFFALGDWGNNETFVTPPGGHDDPGHQSALITWKGWIDAALVGEMTNATNVSDPRYIRIESAATL